MVELGVAFPQSPSPQTTLLRTDPFCALAAGAAALYGPLHGGANEAVLRMLAEIGTVDAVPQFLLDVKARKRKLRGFGHRVYKVLSWWSAWGGGSTPP